MQTLICRFPIRVTVLVLMFAILMNAGLRGTMGGVKFTSDLHLKIFEGLES